MIKAVIFDLDGVLVNSEPLWEQAIAAYLTYHGHTIPGDYATYANRYMRGRGQTDVTRALKRQFKLRGTNKQLTAARLRWVVRLFKVKLKPMPGARAMLRRLTKQYPLALASSAPRVTVNLSVQLLGGRSLFQTILTGEHVRRAKPDPEIYRQTAQSLKFPARQCVVVEDSLAGQQATKRAGMRCILLKTAYSTREQLRQADYVITQLKSLPRLVQTI